MFEQALTGWQAWGVTAKPRLIKTFTAGENHHTGLIQAGDESYVLKIFEHSFTQAIEAQQWAAQRNLSPNILFADADIAIMEYAPEPATVVSEIADSLQQLHQQRPPPCERFDLLKFCHSYLQVADETSHQWHELLMPALTAFINDATPWCFCHNDLVTENCLRLRQKAIFIDWEYAQLHNPWFDLAAIVLYFKLDDLQARSFLGHYRSDWANKVDDDIFYQSQIALLWADLLWHINKMGQQYRHNRTDRFKQLCQLAAKLEITLTP